LAFDRNQKNFLFFYIEKKKNGEGFGREVRKIIVRQNSNQRGTACSGFRPTLK
jgi:hypothetical protein